MIENLIIVKSQKHDFKTYENSSICIFIDCFMTTMLYNKLKKLNNKNKLYIYIYNKGKISNSSLDFERELIVNSIEKGKKKYNSDFYHYYELLDISLYNYLDMKIGIIADEIQYTTFENTTNLLYINDKTIEEVLESNVDFVLFITSWHGLYKEYHNMDRKSVNNKFHTFLKKFQKQNIPIVFYSKEDPPNYKTFSQFTKYSDIILTSSLEKVEEYKKLKNEVEVENFTYGVNPMLHNPIKEREDDIIMFAGTWFNGKYENRMKDTNKVFNYIDKSGEKFIFHNRNFDLNNPLFELPPKFKKYEKPSLPYNELIRSYKKYKWHINLNSIIDDYTMCAVRVYELQAMGKNILTNYSIPMIIDFPNTSIFYDDIKKKENDIEDIILGVRNIYTANTVMSFWGKVLFYLGKSNIFRPNDVIFKKEINNLLKEDAKNAFKYTNASHIGVTKDPTEYYTYKNKIDNENVIGQLVNYDKENYFLIPESKYYKEHKAKILKIDISNWKFFQQSMEDFKDYILLLDDEIKHSKYIKDELKKFNVRTLENIYEVHNIGIFIDKEILNLVKLLKYYGEFEFYKIKDNNLTKETTFKFGDEKSTRLIKDVKNCIKYKEKYYKSLENYKYNKLEV